MANNITPKMIDLFAGIGGIRIGFKNAGYDCVYSSEIDSECQKTYFLNFHEYPHGDITQIDAKSIPNHDVLAGGFPCQPFSISGKQKGFEDTRGTLFFDVLRIINEKQPKVVFLENVKHLKHHDSGKTLKVIISQLEKAGYKVSWKSVYCPDYGIPQNRRRLVLLASRYLFTSSIEPVKEWATPTPEKLFFKTLIISSWTLPVLPLPASRE